MNFKTLYQAALRKRAAAVLTPEAEQAAVQGGMPPQGAPADPSMMGGQPPADPAAQGGMPPAAAGPNGGQIPPEILQDQGFIQWLASQGVQLDPQSGTFIDMQSGQPLPADAIMQAYDMYMQQTQGAASGGAPAPDGGQPPPDPAMMGGMPPEGMGGQPPMDPSMMGGQPPMDPATMGGQPTMDPGAMGSMPPELMQLMQDPGFLEFMQMAAGATMDQSGQLVDQSGQPLPPEMLMQAAMAYMQQGGGMPGADQGMGGVPSEGDMGGAGMPQEGDMGGMPPAGTGAPGMQGGLPTEVMDQIQSAVDASLKSYTAQLDKKMETLLDKLDTVKQALESLRDTDDLRSKAEKDSIKAAQDDIAAELSPVTKTASVEIPVKRQPAKRRVPAAPLSVFDLLM